MYHKVTYFREKKELEGEIKNLKALINPGTRDEDLERNLYVNMIKRFVHIARGTFFTAAKILFHLMYWNIRFYSHSVI